MSWKCSGFILLERNPITIEDSKLELLFIPSGKCLVSHYEAVVSGLLVQSALNIK